MERPRTAALDPAPASWSTLVLAAIDMAQDDGPMYRVGEFATLAGVTVRALRLYDRLGLLKPRRTSKGYRVYAARDLATLEQIVALKFIGVPLRGIPVVRRGTREAIANALGAQRRTLEAKGRLLARAVEAIREAEATLRTGRDADLALYKRIIEVIQMQNDEEEWSRKYDELVAQKMAHLKAITKETRDGLRQEWIDLVSEIKETLDEDPGGPKEQALADRWLALLKQVSGVADDAIARHFASRPMSMDAERILGRLPDAERARVKATFEPFTDKRVWEFVRRAMAARSPGG